MTPYKNTEYLTTIKTNNYETIHNKKLQSPLCFIACGVFWSITILYFM